MMRSTKHMKRFEIAATDGPIGSVEDFYFDDERWAMRYLVVDTGKWLPGRRVLISPLSIARAEWGEQRLLLSITRDQVKNSPDVDTHKPVSRRHESDYLDHYAYPYYWGHAGLWGAHAYPMLPPREPSPEELARQRARNAEENRKAAEQGDTHLRSASEVSGYVIGATDGDLGHVEEFLFDDSSWAIRYLVVDTSNWWFGKRVLVAPDWINEIRWPDRSVSVKVTRAWLQKAPQYDGAGHVDRQWEAAYYQHLEQPRYWRDDDDAQAIKQARSHLREEDPALPVPLERRSRPR